MEWTRQLLWTIKGIQWFPHLLWQEVTCLLPSNHCQAYKQVILRGRLLPSPRSPAEFLKMPIGPLGSLGCGGSPPVMLSPQIKQQEAPESFISVPARNIPEHYCIAAIYKHYYTICTTDENPVLKPFVGRKLQLSKHLLISANDYSLLQLSIHPISKTKPPEENLQRTTFPNRLQEHSPHARLHTNTFIWISCFTRANSNFTLTTANIQYNQRYIMCPA